MDDQNDTQFPFILAKWNNRENVIGKTDWYRRNLADFSRRKNKTPMYNKSELDLTT